MILLAIREFAKGFMSSQIGKAEPNGFGKSSEREYTMRDDEQEDRGQQEEQSDQEDNNKEEQIQEENNAPEIFKILYALGERFPSIWEKIKDVLKQSTSTLGVRLIVILLYAYASIIGLIYEWELYKINDLKLNLFNYLAIGDFLFLALKNGHSFFAFVLGLLFVPLLVCIVFASAIIGCSLVLDIIHLLVFKTHRYLDRVARMKWHEVLYLNYRDKIPDNAVISSRLKHFVFFAPLIVFTIIKNIYIAIFRIAIPWLLHNIKSHLAGIGASFFGIWGKIIALLKSAFNALLRPVLQPVLKLSLIVLFLVSIVSPVLLVLFPKDADGIVQNLPLIRDFGFKFSPPPALGGQLRTTRPSRCIDGAKHISSTDKYVMFSVPVQSDERKKDDQAKKGKPAKKGEPAQNSKQNRQLLVIPGSNLASFQVGELGPCKSETDAADMKGDIAKVQLELAQSAEAGDRRDGEIGTLKAVVKDLVRVDGGLAKAVQINTNDGSKRDEDITKLKVAVKDLEPIDGGLTQAVKKLQAGVQKNTEAGGRRDVAIDALWASVNTTWETVDENAEASGKKDVVINALEASVNTTRKAVDMNTEAGGRRDGEIGAIKESAKLKWLTLLKSIEAGGKRDEVIKALRASVQTNRLAAVENTQADDRRDAEIEAIRESVKQTTEAGGRRDIRIKALQEKVIDIAPITGELTKVVGTLQAGLKQNTDADDKRDGEIKANKESLDTTYESVKSNRLALQKSIEAGGRRDDEIKAIKESAKATREKLEKRIGAAVAIEGEIEAIRGSVKKNTEAGAKRDGEIKTIKDSLIAGAKVTSDIKTIKKTVDATHEDVKKNAEGSLARDGELKTAVDATHEAVIESAKVVVAAVDAAHGDVKKNAEDSFARDGEIKAAVGESKKVIDRLLARHPGIPVTRFETLEKIGSETISEIRYLFAGFKPRIYELNDEQRSWLVNFYSAVKSCKTDSGPSLRLVGFASSKDFSGQKTMKHKNICAPKSSNSTNELSNVKNCYLANERVVSVAAFLETLQPKGQNYDTIMKQIDRRCKSGESEVIKLSGELNFMKIKPWCHVEDMEKARISIRNSEAQPDFLNRSVHIIFEKLGKCAKAGFSKPKQ